MKMKFLNSANGSQKVHKSGKITLTAAAETDFFVGYDTNTDSVIRRGNAPFLFQEITGDFVITVKVEVDFTYTYDSGVLMLMSDENLWAKVCFEQTDFATIAVVSVVTENFSDDANGCNIRQKYVYLKAVRVKNNISFHYSLDGEVYNMVRLFNIPFNKTIYAGLACQSPVGKGTTATFDDLEIKAITVNNIRTGQ
ncbi:DUF1349 domain-containing protein [Candidatus Epulonipiscium viviparus]|uniref:DUF1349 domain-containing protein n=1 Tax=Candidatus Epulonipiscium viviparus TaxID=420336 RepID=UPI00016C0C88|nr:DUF1349 domain-containing protein [Candidatus Epulopiscium viviparus]